MLPILAPRVAAASTEVEVLIVEARERGRRRRRIIVLAIATVLGIAASTFAIRTWLVMAPAATGGIAATVAPVAGMSGVTGYIQPCIGVGPPGRLSYPAGVVAARPAHERLVGTYQSPFRPVVPPKVVAIDLVKADQKFHFHLPPGRYVLVAHFEGTVISLLNVSITAGAMLHRDIPASCK
jgi:hypothetical protein